MGILDRMFGRSLRVGAPRTASIGMLKRELTETLKRGERQAALALCDDILARAPDDQVALLAAAVNRLKTGDPERAAAHFARLEELASGGARTARLVSESLMDPARAGRGEAYVAALDDVLVDTNFWSVIQGKRIFTRETQARTVSNSPLVRGRVTPDHRQCVITLPRVPERLDRIETPCVLLGSDGNYAHWVLRNVLKLALIEAARVPADAPFLVRDDLRGWEQAYLTLLAIPEARLLRVPTDRIVRCRRLYVPTQLRNHPRMADGIAWLRAKLASHSAPPDPARALVYASRREQSKRRLLNEVQVEEVLAQQGFRVIVPGEMTVQEQIAAFSCARVVVAPHGAGLANMVFAPPGASMVEITNSAIVHMDEFRYLCKAAGHHAVSVVSQDMDAVPATDSGPAMHRDYRVNVEELRAVVREVLAAHTVHTAQERTRGAP